MFDDIIEELLEEEAMSKAPVVVRFVKELPKAQPGRRLGQVGGGKYARHRAVLQTRPGQWAVITKRDRPALASTVASQWRTGEAWRGYEIAARQGSVYARYVGEV